MADAFGARGLQVQPVHSNLSDSSTEKAVTIYRIMM
jgi:hypothetical protein